MYEVVIHLDYGGFGLSKEAVTRIVELIDNKDLDIDPECESSRMTLAREIPRHHPALVRVVKDLGGKAHDDADRARHTLIKDPVYPLWPFQVVSVHDEYRVHEYDGSESVTEPHKMSWTKASDVTLDDASFYIWKCGTKKHKDSYDKYLAKRKREEELMESKRVRLVE